MAQCLITDISECGDTVTVTEFGDSEFYSQCSSCGLNAGTKPTQAAAIAAYNVFNTPSRTVANFRAAMASGTIIITGA